MVVPSNTSPDQFRKLLTIRPVTADKLSHIVALEAPDVTSSALACAPNYARANMEAAGILSEVLWRILSKAYEGEVSRSVVLYKIVRSVERA